MHTSYEKESGGWMVQLCALVSCTITLCTTLDWQRLMKEGSNPDGSKPHSLYRQGLLPHLGQYKVMHDVLSRQAHCRLQQALDWSA